MALQGRKGRYSKHLSIPVKPGGQKNKTCQRARGRKVIFRMISRRRAKTLIAHLCIRESRTSECQGRSAAHRSVTGLRTRWAACARGSRRGKAGSIPCVGGLSEAAVDTKFSGRGLQLLPGWGPEKKNQKGSIQGTERFPEDFQKKHQQSARRFP